MYNNSRMSIKSPIIDSIVKVVFDSSVPSQALVGILYQKFKSDLKTIENLPILQVPAEIRQQNPELLKQPNYLLMGSAFTVSLGEGVVYIGCVIDRQEKYYQGWDIFGAFANKVLKFMVESEYITSVNAVSVQYINFFDEPGLQDKTNLLVKVADEKVEDKKMNVFFNKNDDEKKLKIKLVGDAKVNSKNFKSTQGAVIDITSSQEVGLTVEKLKSTIDELHLFAENAFFDVVQTDAIPSDVVRRES